VRALLLTSLALQLSLLGFMPSARAEDAVSAPHVDLSWRPGKGLRLASDDGRFRLDTALRAQFLYVLDGPSGGDDAQNTLMIRRARLWFAGFAFGKHNRFKIELAFSPRDLGLSDGQLTRSPALSWFAEFDYLRDLTLRVGQYKVPFSRQRVTSSGKQQFVDRSRANGEFNLDRDIGADLRSTDLFGLGLLRYALYVGIGEGRDGWSQPDNGPMVIARLEFYPLGLFKDTDEVDHSRSSRPRLTVGMAYAHVRDAKGNRGIIGSAPADGGTTHTHHLVGDLAFLWRGLSVHSEFHWRQGTRNPGNAIDEAGQPIPVEAPRDGYGFFAQAGYLLGAVPLEPSARYSRLRPLGDNSSLPPTDALGVGLSWYIHRHMFKLQADYFRVWSESIGAGGRHRARLQLQASF
jgi:phosphate-selective porin OprO/OprP